MEKGNSSSASGIGRTKSDQLVELVVNNNNKSSSSPASNESPAGGGNLSRKSSRRASPGKSSSIRKSRSAQLKVEVVDEVSSGAALSRASSASFGLSFSFTGFTLPPDHDDEIIADFKPFSDDDHDIPEDIEAGSRKPKFETEPTLPIFLKATMKLHFIAIDATNRNIHTIQWLASNIAWVCSVLVWSGSVLYIIMLCFISV